MHCMHLRTTPWKVISFCQSSWSGPTFPLQTPYLQRTRKDILSFLKLDRRVWSSDPLITSDSSRLESGPELELGLNISQEMWAAEVVSSLAVSYREEEWQRILVSPGGSAAGPAPVGVSTGLSSGLYRAVTAVESLSSSEKTGDDASHAGCQG